MSPRRSMRPAPSPAVPGFLRGQFALLPLEGFPRRQVGVALRSRGLPSAPTRALIDLLYAAVDPRIRRA